MPAASKLDLSDSEAEDLPVVSAPMMKPTGSSKGRAVTTKRVREEPPEEEVDLDDDDDDDEDDDVEDKKSIELLKAQLMKMQRVIETRSRTTAH
jgi:hypothetical protein